MSPAADKDMVKCEGCANRTIVVGLLANFFLAIFKLFVGFLGRSRALIGSGMCNLSDIVTSIAAIIGVRYSKRPANMRYPYGYGKIEFIVQSVMSLFMILGTAAIILSSTFVIAKRVIVVPHMVVFFTAILSAIVNGLLYKYSHCGAKQLNSPVLKAHAEHNKIDVISSLLVAIGVIVAQKGMHWVDPAIAIFESVHVIHGSYIILMDGVKGIMDTSLPEQYIEKIRAHILEVKGVRKIEDIRARQTGRKIVLDVLMQLDADLTVLEAKRINQAIKTYLRSEDKNIGNIMIQVVPAEV
ncbi:MAG: cation transporter [Candidatus Omnitrophica bacterium]|nr:cation transporter [Candidatus Omnitrophota bacterium]